MRAVKAKELRRAAYGDISLRVKREMKRFVTTFRHMNKLDAITGKPIETRSISWFSAPQSPRAIYQLMKRAYKSRGILASIPS